MATKFSPFLLFHILIRKERSIYLDFQVIYTLDAKERDFYSFIMLVICERQRFYHWLSRMSPVK